MTPIVKRKCPGCHRPMSVFDGRIATHGSLGWTCPGAGRKVRVRRAATPAGSSVSPAEEERT